MQDGEIPGAQALVRLGHQPFSARKAEAYGLSWRRLAGLVAAGLVTQVLRGVYVVGAGPDGVEARAACLALVLPPGAAVSRRTAAWLWGIDARAPGEHRGPVPLECTVPTGREPLSRPGMRCYVAPLADADVAEVAGVPCTTPLRTAIDLLRWLPPHMGLGSADAMAHSGLLVPAHLRDEVERFRGAKGVAQARRLAGLVDPRTESFGESWLKLRIDDAGFPPPEPQITLLDDAGREVYRLDMGWLEIRHALEYDGEEYHSLRPDRQADDAHRDHITRDWKWQVTPVTKSLVLGTSLRLEHGIGEILGMTPRIYVRRW